MRLCNRPETRARMRLRYSHRRFMRYMHKNMNIILIFVPEMDKEADRILKKAVGEFLKTERHNRLHKMTQKSMAQLIDISQEQYSRIENGKGRLGILELHTICNRLGVTLTDLVFRMEGLLYNAGLLSPAREKQYRRWLSIYNAYYGISDIKKMSENENGTDK